MSCCYCFPACRFVEQGEQLLLEGCTEKYVVNGPTTKCVGPCYSLKERRNGTTLKNIDFIKTQDDVTGAVQIIKGPQLYFLGPYEKIVSEAGRLVQPAYTLGPTQYIIVQDTTTGTLTTHKGPLVWFPGPYDSIIQKHGGAVIDALALKANEYVKIIDSLTGVVRLERGENLIYLSPTEDILGWDKKTGGVRQAVNVDEKHAVLVRNIQNGQLRLVTKKELFFPKWNEEIEKVQEKVILADHESVILKDKSGTYHFKTGLSNKEEKERRRKKLAEKQQQTKIVEDEKADLKKSKKQKEKEKEKVADVAQDLDLEVDDEDEFERAFFIPPYCELLVLQWSDGLKKDGKKDVRTIDMRPQFMNYLFTCRTTDNVELEIDLTMFWQVLDVKKLIEKTDDPIGDICFHSRSVVIQVVSKVTLEKFMSDFNTIVAEAVLNKADTFCAERGCIVHTVEMKAMHCKDPDTEKVLQEIIKERTDRLNRLQKQQSENEVKLFKMKGEIEEEKLNGELLSIRFNHHRVEAEMEGFAESSQVKAFFSNLKGEGVDNVDFDTKLAIWHQLRKLDMVRSISNGDSRLYLTPENVNLSIETFESVEKNPRAAALKKKEEQNKKKNYSTFTNDK